MAKKSKDKIGKGLAKAQSADRPCRCTQVIGGGLNLWYLDPSTGRYSDGPYPGTIAQCRACYQASTAQSKGRKARATPNFLR